MTELKKVLEGLDNNEISALNILSKVKEIRLEDLAEKAGLKTDTVRHVTARLNEKKLIDVTEDKRIGYEAGDEGKQVWKNGFIEKRLIKALNSLKGKASMKDAGSKSGLDMQETRIAMGWAKRNGWITINGEELTLLPEGKAAITKETNEERLLTEIVQQTTLHRHLESEHPELLPTLKILKKRGDLIIQKEHTIRTITLTELGKKAVKTGLTVEETTNVLTPKMIKTGEWKNAKLRKYDVEAPVPNTYPGRLHPVTQVTEYIRRVWLELGFTEMKGPMIDTEFWVFDALFTPQDHPAREMQDTLFIDGKGPV
ncbi:MAG: hypothetical protein GOV15_01015, partial [Candidatus Diapherotrites archaeon]|nr:hypothetical protein [Candidatus Diapherotrites archaeon]